MTHDVTEQRIADQAKRMGLKPDQLNSVQLALIRAKLVRDDADARQRKTS